MSNNQLMAWGCGHDGRLGLGHEKNVVAPVGQRFFEENNLTVKQVVCGGFHTFVITNKGVYTFGLCEYGQLGLGERQNRLKPTLVPFLEVERLRRLDCGAYHSLAWMDDGLYACGRNDHGQLGLGDNEDRKSFTKVDSISDPTSIAGISCGSYHTLVLLKDLAVPSDENVSAEVNGTTLSDVESVKVVPYVVAACGKGDFGELGYNADSWDLADAQQKLLSRQAQEKAKHMSAGGEADDFSSTALDGPVMKPKFNFKKPTNTKKRRAMFSHSTLKPVVLPAEFWPVDAPWGPAQEIVEVSAMHHKSAVKLATGAVFEFGCYYCNEIEGEESSIPRKFDFPNIHAGEEVIFGWNEDGTELYVKGTGNLGCGEEDEEAKSWKVVPLPTGFRVTAMKGKSHFMLVGLLSEEAPGDSSAMAERAAVLAFGDNFMGQLGIGSDDEKAISPTAVHLPEGKADITCGFRHTFALVSQ